jgi:hypothetical protein
MKSLNLFLVCFSFLLKTFGQPSHQIIKKSIGNFNLSIYLPPGYDTLKVLYFNDGQSIFGNYSLKVNESTDYLINNKLIEPVIIVGIHSDSARASNYIPYADEYAKNDFGNYTPNSIVYTKKLIKQIIPFIQKKYKTKPGAGIAGYSFGGLHATWAALNFPDQFIFSGSLSPSYWVNNFEILNEAAKVKLTQTYYFDVGTAEWNYYVPMLIYCKLPILNNIFYYEDFGGQHNIESWRGQRVKNMLLIFAGNTDTAKYTWEIVTELIKSSITGKLYPRVNPVITYSNGLRVSLSYAANFNLLNKADGIVNKDGSIKFLSKNDLSIKITFKNEEKIIVVKYSEYEKLLNGYN